MDKNTKTHWLQSPNKNYLGHWDLPNGQDLTLTIKTAQWEEVKNPITNTSEAKRVIRFVEDIKPMICNQTNAQSILDSTGEKFMEDCGGKKIRLYVSTVRVKKCEVDCIRVRKMTQEQLQPKTITIEQVEQLQNLISQTDKTVQGVCEVLQINSLKDLPESKFKKVISSLEKLKK